MFNSLLGALKIVEVNYLTVQQGTIKINRPWKERLFTRPWKPWISTKEIANIVPDLDVYVLEGGTVLAHPATAMKIREAQEIQRISTQESLRFVRKRE